MANTVLSGSDLEVPSGFEVESAAFHPTFRSRVDALRSRGVARARDLQHRAVDRGIVWKGSLRHSMQTRPELWIGVAAAAGLSLGLLGRFVQWRKRRHLPELIVIGSPLLGPSNFAINFCL